MSNVAVIGVPSSAGARSLGQERAPQAFRRAGLIERLRSAGLEVTDFGDLPEVAFRPDTGHPNQQNLGRVCEVAHRVAEQVHHAARQQLKPIVLGGDCTITLGVIAGLVRQHASLGLIYFDGDVDLNTPSETPSGILDGMVLAHATGSGADTLTHIGHRYPLMPEEHIVLFGYNPEAGWIDPAEMQRLEQASMLKYPVPRVRKHPKDASRKALTWLEGKAERILVHFDVDVIDCRDFPVGDVPHEHGLRFDEAMEVLSIFLSSRAFGGLVITEFNARRDEDGTQAQRLVNGVVSALERGRTQG